MTLDEGLAGWKLFDNLNALGARWAAADADGGGWVREFDVTEIGIAALALDDLAGSVGDAGDGGRNTFLSVDGALGWLAAIARVVGRAVTGSARIVCAIGARSLGLSALSDA